MGSVHKDIPIRELETHPMYKKTLTAAVILAAVAAPVAAYAAAHGELGSRAGHDHVPRHEHGAPGARRHARHVRRLGHVLHRHGQPGRRRQQREGLDRAARPGRATGVGQADQPNLDGAYLVSDQARSANGRQYTFALSAAEAPQGSALKFAFHTPGQRNAEIVRCTGGGATCTAQVGIGGGASNRLVVVQLPRTDLGLVSVRPSSSTLRGAYSLSDQRLRKGDSEYQLVLSAVEGTPAGSNLILTFARY